MSDSPLKIRITDDMKASLRAGEKERLAAIRLILAAIKQREVDERIELTDADVIAVLDKMSKQRRESIDQFSKAGRTDLVDKENAELTIIQSYMPQQLSEKEIDSMIADAIKSTGASSIKDMGKVMGLLKPKLQGRADMAKVGASIKSKLGS
ncbi:MAG TPA: GatB/YqeY domain-containing protein [Gammaproteobacteria bacterium]